MRLLICGSRDWADRKLMLQAMLTLSKDTTIIHGAARGADTIAAEIAIALGLSIDLPPTTTRPLGGYPAHWHKLGRRAGPERNTRMLVEGKPDQVWAFHDDIWHESKGTRDMANQAIEAGVPVVLYTTEMPPSRLTHRFLVQQAFKGIDAALVESNMKLTFDPNRHD